MVTSAWVIIGEVCVPLGMRSPMLIALLLLAGGTLLAAPEDFEGRPIAALRFAPESQPLPESELRELIAPLAPGARLLTADVRSAIQNLYSTGRFTDIRVEATAEPSGVALRFVTERAYFVGRVTVEGSTDPPNAGALATATKLQLGTQFVDTDIPQATDNIMERLRSNGLYHATVTHALGREPEHDQVDIDFTIDPGKRARFGGIVLQGNPLRSPAAVIRSTRWRRFWGFGPWKPFTEQRLQAGLDGLRSYYQKNNHLLARVALTRLDYDEPTNRVTPLLRIDPGPVVRVRVEGAKLSKGKMRSLLPMYQEHSVDQSLLVEGRRNLIEYFQSQGYFDVDADFEQFPGDNGVQVIEYIVDRSGRHKLVDLEIDGNHYFDDRTLRERMYIQPASFIRFRHGRYSERYLSRDIDAIEQLYRSNGFQDAKVTPTVTDDYAGKKGDIGVQLHVDEGAQWFVAQMELEGASTQDRGYLLGVMHSTEGQPFSEYNLSTDRDTILSYYFNNGYPQAQFDWSQTEIAPQRVSLRLLVTPGPRRFVRDVVVNGFQTTRASLIQKRITIGPGDPLSQIDIAETQRRLYDLGIFAKVETAIQNPEGNEESKYVLYQVEEARRYSVNVGFGAELGRIGTGVTTFDAPAGSAGFAPRVSLGVTRNNVFGLGHTVSLQSRFSSLQQRATLSYFAPQVKGNESLNLTFIALYDDSRDVRTYESQRLEGSVQLGQKLSRANTIQYRFTYRDVYVPPESVKISPQLIPILAQSVRVGIAGTSFIRDRRDDPTDARRGDYNTIDFGLSTPAFGSESSFTRINMRNATYHHVTKDVIFARSIIFGYIHRLGGLPDIPLPERIFSGGASSHRGFPDNQAGPRDPVTGFPLGGKALLINTFELRFPLLGDNVGGVLFHDAGNVYSNVRNISFRYSQRDLTDFDYMVHAFGFGIRYRTPIGPLRLDLSAGPNSPRFYGFQGSRDELLTCSAPGAAVPCTSVTQRINVFQFHFSLGQAF